MNYPERFAQEALGHNSKAMHRAYAKRALIKIPSLEDFERQAAENLLGQSAHQYHCRLTETFEFLDPTTAESSASYWRVVKTL
jgi:hypothetical protein